MTYRIGVIAALDPELKPLVRGWAQQPDGSFLIQRGEVVAIARARGMGAARAADAVADAATYGELHALISLGWAGGTSCGVQPGIAYEIGEVVDAVSKQRYTTAAATNSIKLVTTDHVAGRDEKRNLAETYGASLVDMEASTVARLAMEMGIPFYCWKSITDIATEDLPDLNAFMDESKQLQMTKLAAYTLTRPRFIAPLLRMGRNSRAGAEALGRTIRQWLEEGHYADSTR